MKTFPILLSPLIIVGLPSVYSLAFPQRPSSQTPPAPTLAKRTNHHHANVPHPLSRRKALVDSSGMALATLGLLVATQPMGAQATETLATSSNENTLTVQTILQALRTVPTFCIVNDEGAAYMLYKPNEGFAKGYAFMTYEGADVVLKDALVTAEKGGYLNTWSTATITVVPADIAMRLTLQPRERTSQKDQKSSSILFLIPGASDREAALQIDRTKFSDQGKVPVFYLDTYRNNQGALPLYFNPRDLVADWQRSTNADSNAIPPRIQVIDLVTLFGLVVRGRTAEVPAVLRNNPLVFVPNAEVVQKAKELQKGGNLAPYKLDRMVV
eukprot:scaffold629_cov168-Amphora_coffeaeformis.AAC.2